MGKKLLDSGFKVATNKENPQYSVLQRILQDDDYYTIEIGKSNLLRKGDDITIIT